MCKQAVLPQESEQDEKKRNYMRSLLSHHQVAVTRLKEKWNRGKQRRAACYFQWLLWLPSLTAGKIRCHIHIHLQVLASYAVKWCGQQCQNSAHNTYLLCHKLHLAFKCLEIQMLSSHSHKSTSISQLRGFHQHLFSSETASSHILPTRQLPQNELLINC